jgi:hypothetical protein
MQPARASLPGGPAHVLSRVPFSVVRGPFIVHQPTTPSRNLRPPARDASTHGVATSTMCLCVTVRGLCVASLARMCGVQRTLVFFRYAHFINSFFLAACVRECAVHFRL